MVIAGYLIEVDYDGDALRVHARTKAAAVAFGGKDHGQDATVPVREMRTVALKEAGRLIQGNLAVTTKDGRRYLLQYRRAQQPQFTALYADLRAAIERASS
ncbi:MAG: hypothetical protein EPO13_01820 [Actinomycetota bacterium]|nr:MAG: hypothetical protein EPO13_01820 [Actinomycetota bacterium]